MEKIGETLSHKNPARQFNYEELVRQIVEDPDVAAFIKQEKLSQSEISRSISKFNQYISERNRFLLEDEAYIAKGYKPILIKNAGYADVSRGIGVIVVGLASLIIGEVLFQSLTLAERLITIVVGAIAYQFLIWGVIALGFNTNYLRLYSAVILAVCLMIPTLKNKFFKGAKLSK